jgi:hypothetical protein
MKRDYTFLQKGGAMATIATIAFCVGLFLAMGIPFYMIPGPEQTANPRRAERMVLLLTVLVVVSWSIAAWYGVPLLLGDSELVRQGNLPHPFLFME